MMHHSSHAPLSNEVTPMGRRVRYLVCATVALICAWLLLQALAARAHGAGPEGDTTNCRVRYAIMTLREGPGFAFEPIKPPLKRDTAVTAMGRSEKPKWLLVEIENGTKGWALVDQLRCDPLPVLPVVAAPPEPKPTPRPATQSRATGGRVTRDRASGNANATDLAADSLTEDDSPDAPDVPDFQLFYLLPPNPEVGPPTPTPTTGGF